MSWHLSTTPEGLAVHTWDGAPPDAPLVVLLHGLTDSGPCWQDAAQRWGSSYRVVAPDALGHGSSRRFTRAELAGPDPLRPVYDTLEPLLERLVAEHGAAVVGGHSMGGGLAGALASRRPDLVRAALLEDPVWIDVPPEMLDGPQARKAARGRVTETRRARRDPQRLADELGRANPSWPRSELLACAQASADADEAFLGSARAMLTEPWDRIATGITVPTLVVTGSGGVIVGPRVRERIAALENPHIEVAVVEGADHCVRRDRTEAFHALVDPWLAAVAQGRAQA